jgi:serine/threonine protein kinase
MKTPTPGEYAEALEYPELTLSDPRLKRGSVESNHLGPVAVAGAVAVAFRIRVDGHSYALRCFWQLRDGLADRYRLISDELRLQNIPEIVSFQWQPAGISVAGHTYPTVVMPWVEGDTLGVWIERSRKDRDALASLRASLARCATNLGKRGLAHGDIQSNNIIIPREGELRLIDYDGFFVPQAANFPALESGHPNFQHPQRRTNTPTPYNERIDAFSFFALDVALECLQADPGLWERTASDTDCIVFRAEDFRDPGASERFRLASQLPTVGRRVEALAALAQSDIDSIPTAEELLSGAPNKRARSQRPATPRTTVAAKAPTPNSRQGYIASSPVLSADDVDSCFGAVGKYVELVGQIASVRHARTKYNTPFAHLVLGPTFGRAVQVTIWSTGLKSLAGIGRRVEDYPVGAWVSVTGVVDPPFSVPSWTRVGITLTRAHQLVLITPAEAAHRLQSVGRGPTSQLHEAPKDPWEGVSASARSSSPNRRGKTAPRKPTTPSQTAPTRPAARFPAWVWFLGATIVGVSLLLLFILGQASGMGSNTDPPSESPPQVANAENQEWAFESRYNELNAAIDRMLLQVVPALDSSQELTSAAPQQLDEAYTRARAVAGDWITDIESKQLATPQSLASDTTIYRETLREFIRTLDTFVPRLVTCLRTSYASPTLCRSQALDSETSARLKVAADRMRQAAENLDSSVRQRV